MNKIVLRHNLNPHKLQTHPWIYRSQIKEIDPKVKPGSLAEVFQDKDRFVGVGYFNPKSEISVRILSRKKEAIDKALFLTKIRRAMELRKKVVKESNAFRLISSEGDDLPGLIVDQYSETLVVQFLTLGMEQLRPLVIEALQEAVSPKGIFEKSDSGSRRIEGLDARVEWIQRECGDEVLIHERDVQFKLDFGKGQKTGFYLDQRDNRLLLRDLGIRGQVLDAFCFSGGFALHMAKSGCQVLGIDSQSDAIAQAEENQRLNGISQETLQFRIANVFDELKSLEKEKRKFDLVILDPPSFVKKKESLEGALAGYKEIILRSFKLLNEGGTLAVFSCSYHVDENLLMQTVLSAALDTRKSLKLLKFLKQSADHPMNPFIPETYYLKGFLFLVTS